MQQVQRHLQLRIEAQGKYLQSVLEKAQEALASQNVDLDAGVLGAAAAAETQQLSELISRASATDKCGHHQHPGVGDGSVDSCLTACEGSQRDHDMLSIGLSSPPPAPTPRGGGGGYPFEAARSSGNERRGGGGGASTSCCEGFLFLEEHGTGSGRRGRSSSSDEQQQELDLNIKGSNTTRRPRNCDKKIDLNGSSWN
jgi:hypothetical protein